MDTTRSDKTETDDSTSDMTLNEHMEMLGATAHHMNLRSGLVVPQAVIERALQGQPISYAHALVICRLLNEAHGLSSGDPSTGVVGYLPEHIKGLNIYKPHSKHLQEK
jgi:hypothetical protein